MKKWYIVILSFTLAILISLNYHFILFDDSLRVLSKTELTFDDTFIDGRGSKKFELLLKPALIEAGIRDLVEG